MNEYYKTLENGFYNDWFRINVVAGMYCTLITVLINVDLMVFIL